MSLNADGADGEITNVVKLTSSGAITEARKSRLMKAHEPKLDKSSWIMFKSIVASSEWISQPRDSENALRADKFQVFFVSLDQVAFSCRINFSNEMKNEWKEREKNLPF